MSMNCEKCENKKQWNDFYAAQGSLREVHNKGSCYMWILASHVACLYWFCVTTATWNQRQPVDSFYIHGSLNNTT